MLKGCACGSRVFRQGAHDAEQLEVEVVDQGTESKNTEETSFEDDSISIMVQESGVYSVNIESLAKRESGMEPIFVQDQSGKINVLFNPDA